MTHATYGRRLAHKRIEDKRGAYENRIKNSELGCVQAVSCCHCVMNI